MMYQDDVEKPTIGMLLDIEHIYGAHEGRIGPIIISICISCIIPFLYMYNALWTVIPIWLVVIVSLIVAARTFMIVMGKEKERKAKFKRQMYSDYDDPAQFMNIRTIHPDGCIEFVNGYIRYLVCAYNGTSDDDVQRSVQLRKLLANMVGDYEYDTYILNINDSPALRDYYKKVATFDKSDASVNFVRIIDHNLDLVSSDSVVTCTLYAIKGTRSDWKDMANQIDMALGSRLARCYKTIYRVKDEAEINALLNRNADTVVNISELLRRKYTNQQYGTSKVLAYDLPDDKEIIQGGSHAKPVIPEQTKSSFHKVFKGD